MYIYIVCAYMIGEDFSYMSRRLIFSLQVEDVIALSLKAISKGYFPQIQSAVRYLPIHTTASSLV